MSRLMRDFCARVGTLAAWGGAAVVGAALGGGAGGGCDSSDPAQAGVASAFPPVNESLEFPFDSMEPVVEAQFREAVDHVKAEPLDAEANGRLGMLFHAYELPALAAPCYRRAAAIAPDEIRWRYYLGLVLAEQGDLEAAAPQFGAVLARRGDDVAAFMQLADVDRARNRLADALAGYRHVIGIAPQLPQAHFGAGQVLAQLGDAATAEKYFREAIERSPQQVYGQARYGLGQALRLAGRTGEALAELELAEQQRGRGPPRYDPLTQAVDALATGAVEALHRGIDVLTAGQTEAAIGLLEEAVRIDPDLAEAHSQLGAAYLTQGAMEAAEASLRRALALNPNYVDALYNLGVLLHRRGETAEAVERFDSVVAIRPDHFDAHLGLGTDLALAGQSADAAAHLHKAEALRPDDPRPYKRLADLLAGIGEFETAIEMLQRGVVRLPQDMSIADRLAWILATCPVDHLRDGPEALRLAEAVNQRTEYGVPQALDTLAAALANVDRFEEAVEIGEQGRQRAIELGDDELVAEIRARLALYRSGRPYRQ